MNADISDVIAAISDKLRDKREAQQKALITLDQALNDCYHQELTFEVTLTHPSITVSAKSPDLAKGVRLATGMYVDRFGDEPGDITCTVRAILKSGMSVRVDKELWAKFAVDEFEEQKQRRAQKFNATFGEERDDKKESSGIDL